jgi:fucose permease
LLGVPVGAIAALIASETGPALHAAPAQIANACGAYFGAGALLATLLLDAAYSAGTPDAGPALLAVIPIAYLAFTWKNTRVWKRAGQSESPLRSSSTLGRPQNVRPLATALLTVLVFLQFGNEWVLAVWLPFFLIRTFGTSPAVAISMLAIHFVFLLIGRWISRTLLAVVDHRRFLLAGIVLSVGAYLLLVTAHSVGTATTAVILIGLALGPVSPIAAENLDRDLPLTSGRRILLAAACGALVEPWIAGYICAGFGVKQTMLVPAFGAILLGVIALLILLESHLMGADIEEQQSQVL